MIYISTIDLYLKELEIQANDLTFQTWPSFKILLQNIGNISLKQLADQQPESELSILKFYGHLIDLDTWIIVSKECDVNKIANKLIENNFVAPEYDPISILLNYPSEIYYDIHFVFFDEFINTLKKVKSKLSYVVTENAYAMYNPIIKRNWRAGQDILFSMRPLYMSQILSYYYIQMWHKIFLKYTPQQIITHLQNSKAIDERIPWLIENNKNIHKHLLQHYTLLQDITVL